MAQLEKETISAIRTARQKLSSLEHDDRETLIQIGAEIESISGLVPADVEIAHETLNTCLTALQVIFEGNSDNFAALIITSTAALAALEHDLGSPSNPRHN